jgi:hypothetical protein
LQERFAPGGPVTSAAGKLYIPGNSPEQMQVNAVMALSSFSFLRLLNIGGLFSCHTLNRCLLCRRKKETDMKHRGLSGVWLAGLICLSLAGCGRDDLSAGSGQDDLSVLRRTAAQGNADAQYLLGRSYFFGTGVPQNYKEVMQWCHLAAEQEYALARSRLGDRCPCNAAVQQDCQEAVKWFRAAAKQGHAGAKMLIGSAYFLGLGVPQNYTEATKWLLLAAEQGDAGAQALLGKCYYFGDGVPLDHVQAYAWFHLASEQGFEKAAEDRSLCSQGMKPEQIEEGQRLSREYAANVKP